MGPLEIIFICLGVVVVVASFVLSDKIWGNDEDKDIKEQKEQLSEEMHRIFQEHANTAQEKTQQAAKEALEQSVEEARREIQVAVNEAKEAIGKLSEEAKEQMEAYVKQMQEEAVGVSADTKEALEQICADQEKKIQECTEQVISEMNNHHNEVTFLYSMINNKQDEIKKDVEHAEQVRMDARDLVSEVKDAVAEMESVKKQADAISQSSMDIREDFITELKEELIQELASEEIGVVRGNTDSNEYPMEIEESAEESMQEESVCDPTKPIDAQEIKEVLQAMGQEPDESQIEKYMAEAESAQEALENEPEVVVADVEEIEEISVQTVKSAVEEVWDDVVAQEADTLDEQAAQEAEPESVEEAEADAMDEQESEAAEPESVEEATADAMDEQESEAVKPESVEEAEADAIDEQAAEPESVEEAEADAMDEQAAESESLEEATADALDEQANEDKLAETEELLPEDIVIEEAPNKMLRAVRESNTVSTDADFAMRKKVLAMYEKGHSSMEISQEVNLGIGEVRMIIDLYSTRER